MATTKNLTQEQNNIIRLSKQMVANESLKIQACAGSGKTSTLVEIAKANPNQSFLYLAFNKSVIEEAKGKFPDNVKIQTTHSLAYAKIIGQGRKKITNKHTIDDYNAIGINNYNDFYDFNKTLNFFLNSNLSLKNINNAKIESLFELVRSGALPYTHSLYLKEYQLLSPKDRGLNNYDFILLDEAQDTNAVTLSIFTLNSCKKILVGDTSQNIYGFRDTINALETMPTTYEKSLTYSFRCKQSILSKACYFLNEYNHKNVFFRSAYQEDKNKPKTLATITRTNAGIIDIIAVELNKQKKAKEKIESLNKEIKESLAEKEEVIKLIKDEGNKDNKEKLIEYKDHIEKLIASKEKKIEENKKINIIKYKLIKEPESIFAASFNLFCLKTGQINKMDKEFKWLIKLSKDELDEVAERDVEIRFARKTVEKYDSRLYNLFDLAKKMYSYKEGEFDSYLTNAHISKGLEWDIVTLHSDFQNLSDIQMEIIQELDAKEKEFLEKYLKEETNLYYVALTRAKDKVIDKTENDWEWREFLENLKQNEGERGNEAMNALRIEMNDLDQPLQNNFDDDNDEKSLFKSENDDIIRFFRRQ